MRWWWDPARNCPFNRGGKRTRLDLNRETMTTSQMFAVLKGKDLRDRNLSGGWPLNTSLNVSSFVIGYGYITPQTSKGKILCIFVALFGIPITMLALKSIGELIVVCVNSSITNLEKKILRRQEAKKVQVKSAVVLFSLMVIFLMVFALLLVNSTDMTLVQCVYFWFVTYTTIGFGDYVPGKIPQSIQRLSFNSSANHDNKATKSLQEFDVPVYVTIFYLLFCMLGFCVVSSVLNSIVAALEVEGHRPWCSWCNSRNIQNHDDGNPLSAVHSDMGVANLNKESSRSVNENVISLSFTETTKD